jgi:hypothetical protein
MQNENSHSTTKYNLKYELKKKKEKSPFVTRGDYLSIANCRKKYVYSATFREIFRIFHGISKCYLFISQFLAEIVTMFCRTLVGKH